MLLHAYKARRSRHTKDVIQWNISAKGHPPTACLLKKISDRHSNNSGMERGVKQDHDGPDWHHK